MTPSPYFQILVREVAASLPVAGRPDGLPCLINLRLGTNVTGPFTGDPDDIGMTVDYSQIVRHILGPFAQKGPFADAPSLAQALADFIFAFDDRILSVKLALRSPADPGFDHQMEWERPA
ncbi:hypothetical protein [Niveispirillum fermenti]|uniref:hypothetical protein n=1 Tax=Niveispirillum fermenti TaxID=1233113 RepID=UPI003A845AD4